MASVGSGMSAVLVLSGRVISGLVLVRVADSGGRGDRDRHGLKGVQLGELI